MVSAASSCGAFCHVTEAMSSWVTLWMRSRREKKSARTLAAYGSGSVGKTRYTPKPRCSTPFSSISASRNVAINNRLLTGVMVNSALRIANAYERGVGTFQSASGDSASVRRLSSKSSTKALASDQISESCERSEFTGNAVARTSTGRSAWTVVSVCATSTSIPIDSTPYESWPARTNRMSMVDRPGGADSCHMRSRWVARAPDALASVRKSVPGTKAIQGAGRITGPSRRARQSMLSPGPTCTARPPIPDASIGCAGLIVATCSIQPARVTGALPASVAQGDSAFAISRFGTETVQGIRIALSAGSHVGAAAVSCVNAAGCA